MTYGKIVEGFQLLPSISISWYQGRLKRHYYISFQWLFWYITTLNTFKFEE